jgi:hypothetical protein
MKLDRWSWLVLLALSIAAVSSAAQRSLELVAPARVAPGATAEVRVLAATDAGTGEQIGFLHVEVSTDSGRNWTPLAYEMNVGTGFDRRWSVTVGAAGTRTLLRVRAAFRGGVAGDVDFNGAAIRWKDSWAAWDVPPARRASIPVGS